MMSTKDVISLQKSEVGWLHDICKAVTKIQEQERELYKKTIQVRAYRSALAHIARGGVDAQRVAAAALRKTF